MRKLFYGIFVGLLLGGLVGFAGGIFLFPYIFPPPEVNESVAGQDTGAVQGRGVFIHADPSDPVHYGKGGVTIYDRLVHLEMDFEVGPGPKYHVYLVPLNEVTPDTAVEQSMFVDLGRLKSFAGSQNYPIPSGVNLEQYRHVVIWCEQFNVLISPAAIKPI